MRGSGTYYNKFCSLCSFRILSAKGGCFIGLNFNKLLTYTEQNSNVLCGTYKAWQTHGVMNNHNYHELGA